MNSAAPEHTFAWEEVRFLTAAIPIRLGGIALVVILGCATSAHGQDGLSSPVPLVSPHQDAPDRPTSSYREGLIHLDARIADQEGRPIPQLDFSGITLLDNGKRTKILSLRPAYPPDINARLAEVALVLDEINSSGMMLAQARSDLISYLRKNNGVLAQPTSVYRLTSTGFYASAQPTTDGNALAGDVERNSFPRQIWRHLGISVPGDVPDTMNNWSKALRSIYALAVKWTDEPGRKALIWIGPGWPVNGYLSSRDDPFPLLVELLSRIREARMVIYQTSTAEGRDRDFAYAVYATGVRSSSELQKHMQYFALQVLAIETGGLVFDQGFRVEDDIDQSIRDARSFYILSFDPPHAALPDEYHDLKIEVAIPGATARSNTGYYDQPVFYDQPPVPAQRVTVPQLESLLERDDKQHDGELAAQLSSMELTERLSSSKLASWLRQIRGKQSREALTVLADASVYLNPPPAEIPARPAPDYKSQVKMLSRTVQYLNQLAPRLPDFYAIRTLAEYDQHVTDKESWKSAAADQSLHEWVTEKSTLLYRNGQEEQVIHKRKEKKSVWRDLSFIGIFGPILHRVFGDALGGNGLAWSHWQRTDQGDQAVFQYSVHSQHPRYEVVSCCLRNGEAFRTDPEYHGEVAIDPQSGAVMRITIQSEPGWIVEPNLTPVRFVRATGMMLEYGPVKIGGNIFICPQRSVVTMRTRWVKPLKMLGQDATVYAPYENMMDDIAFGEYHKFGSESRILPDFEEVRDQKPESGNRQARPEKSPIQH